MEFDLVFLVGVEDGTLPSGLSIMEGDGSIALDEEKRLCYVAMTRAKTELVMTWRREVRVFSNQADRKFFTKDMKRSRFLDHLMPKGASPAKQRSSAGARRQVTTTTARPKRSYRSDDQLRSKMNPNGRSPPRRRAATNQSPPEPPKSVREYSTSSTGEDAMESFLHRARRPAAKKNQSSNRWANQRKHYRR